MRVIEGSLLGAEIERLCCEVSSNLPPDVVAALERSMEVERNGKARDVLKLILENARMAADLDLPICQDTGTFSIYVTLAPGDVIRGDLQKEAARAVARATVKQGLRASMVADPVEGRVNTGDNTPPFVEVVQGEDSSLGVMAKGGGSEMASRMTMLVPGAGWQGALEFITGAIREVGACACPPLILGVGMGGSFDRVAAIAKKALLIPLDRANPDARIARREEELIQSVNRLGIGPGAHGGNVTCIGARIVEAPCHMATFPVAVSVNCHALRRKTVSI